MDAVEALKEKMLLVCKVLQNQGVVDVYGHVSTRLSGERILSTPHMPPGKVALRDLIILDMNGKKLEGFGEPTAKRHALRLPGAARRTMCPALPRG
jgi:hypothetical protein